MIKLTISPISKETFLQVISVPLDHLAELHNSRDSSRLSSGIYANHPGFLLQNAILLTHLMPLWELRSPISQGVNLPKTGGRFSAGQVLSDDQLLN
jgi:hypothetical protein